MQKHINSVSHKLFIDEWNLGPPGKKGFCYLKGERGPKGERGLPGPVGDEGLPGERGDDASIGTSTFYSNFCFFPIFWPILW